MTEHPPASVTVHKRTHPQNGSVVVSLSGELDHSNADSVRAELRALRRQVHGPIAFDLGELTFLDSAGLAVLLDSASADPGVEVVRTSSIVARVIEATGLSAVLRVRA